MSQAEPQKKQGIALKWKIVLGVLILSGLAVLAVALSLSRIAKAGLERGATASLGARTTVSALDLGIFAGSVRLRELAIANPEGYQEGYLLTLDDADMAVDIRSLLSDTIRVRRIILDAPVIRVVGRGIDTNLSTVMAHAGRRAEEPAEQQPGAASKKIDIALIRVTNARFEYQVEGAPHLSLSLPDIELRDIGDEDGKPLMLAEVLQQLLGSIASEAVKTAGGDIPGQFADAMEDIMAGELEKLEDALRGFEDRIRPGEEAIRGVGDLFRGLGEPSRDDSND